MARGTIARRETLSGNDEGGGIRAEVEKELCENIKGEKCFSRKEVIRKSDGDENACKQDESHDLDRFAAQGIDRRDSDPVTCCSLAFIAA